MGFGTEETLPYPISQEGYQIAMVALQRGFAAQVGCHFCQVCQPLLLTKLIIQPKVHRELIAPVDIVAGDYIVSPDIPIEGGIFQVGQFLNSTLGVVGQSVVNDQPTGLCAHRPAMETSHL